MKRSVNFKRIINNTLIIFLCVFSCIGVARFCHHATQGFRLSKVRSNLIESEKIYDAESSDREFAHKLFHQKFHYLGRGLQSFVFESEDGNYVLKLFNNRYQRKIHFFSILSHLPFIRSWALLRAEYYQGKLTKTFKSYKIAFEDMKDKTGLLYTHLERTSNLPTRATIVDRLNICHEINPNNMGFLVQKKATLVYPALKEYLSHQNIEGAKHALSSLVDLFFWKWRSGIDDNDPLIRTNYGFIGEEAIQIDVGPLSKPTTFPDIEEKRAEIEKITTSLKFWLNENAPELIPFLDQELQQQLQSFE